jgi:hypothetical protein
MNYKITAVLICGAGVFLSGCVRPAAAPCTARLDMNADNKIDTLDQLHHNPGVAEYSLASPFNPTDSDRDGIADGPADPNLFSKAMRAKAIWSRSSTHFILRIDSLSRSFQNEFTQLMTDAAILTPEDWAVRKFESYNGVGDAPAEKGYQVAADLPGGKNTPVTLVVIPKKIWDAFGDPDPVVWINNRIANPNLEIGQHGLYHNNNLALSDWADTEAGKFYACETCGFSLEEQTEYLRIGKQTLLGDYSNLWIQQAGADPNLSPQIDWTNAAHPLLCYAPPFNTFDSNTLSALSRNGFFAVSGSVFEENSPIFSPNGSYQGKFDPYGLFHAPADYQVNPVIPDGFNTFEDYLASITRTGGLNTWLIEEVEWSSRSCNNVDRLKPCESGENGVNRENNRVDPNRWQMWMTLLDYVNLHGQPMTMGDYALAMAFDNAPTVYNPDQADADTDGIGDVVENVSLTLDAAGLVQNGNILEGSLRAKVASGKGLPGQIVHFILDVNNDANSEELTAVTDADGVASIFIQIPRTPGIAACWAFWNGGVTSVSDAITINPLPNEAVK